MAIFRGNSFFRGAVIPEPDKTVSESHGILGYKLVFSQEPLSSKFPEASPQTVSFLEVCENLNNTV